MNEYGHSLMTYVKIKSEEDKYVTSAQSDQSLSYYKGIVPFSDHGSLLASLVSVVGVESGCRKRIMKTLHLFITN